MRACIFPWGSSYKVSPTTNTQSKNNHCYMSPWWVRRFAAFFEWLHFFMSTLFLVFFPSFPCILELVHAWKVLWEGGHKAWPPRQVQWRSQVVIYLCKDSESYMPFQNWKLKSSVYAIWLDVYGHHGCIVDEGVYGTLNISCLEAYATWYKVVKDKCSNAFFLGCFMLFMH